MIHLRPLYTGLLTRTLQKGVASQGKRGDTFFERIAATERRAKSSGSDVQESVPHRTNLAECPDGNIRKTRIPA